MHAKDTEQWHTSEFPFVACQMEAYLCMLVQSQQLIYKEAQNSQAFYIVASSETLKMLVRLMWTCANMIKFLHFEFTCSNS